MLTSWLLNWYLTFELTKRTQNITNKQKTIIHMYVKALPMPRLYFILHSLKIGKCVQDKTIGVIFDFTPHFSQRKFILCSRIWSVIVILSGSITVLNCRYVYVVFRKRLYCNMTWSPYRTYNIPFSLIA